MTCTNIRLLICLCCHNLTETTINWRCSLTLIIWLSPPIITLNTLRSSLLLHCHLLGVFQVLSLARLFTRRRTRNLLLLKGSWRGLDYFRYLQSVLHGTAKLVVVWVAALGWDQRTGSAINQHFTSLAPHLATLRSRNFVINVNWLGTDKKLIQCA